MIGPRKHHCEVDPPKELAQGEKWACPVCGQRWVLVYGIVQDGKVTGWSWIKDRRVREYSL